jgi:serine protease Do
MNNTNKIRNNIVAALLVTAAVFSTPLAAQAEDDVAYSTIGFWQINYIKDENIASCYARARFDDQTVIQLSLIKLQNDPEKKWVLYVYNPTWKSWVAKKTEYTFLIDTHKIWRGSFSLTDNKEILFSMVSIEFMNSVADANSLTMMSENGHVFVDRLDMTGSADAIKAVVRCLRSAPNAVPPQQEAQAETTISGTGFFISHHLIVTNNHVINGCNRTIYVRFPDRGSFTAIIYGQDETNDLALLNTVMENLTVASFRARPRLGEAVASYGFPLSGLLSSSGNFTVGNITSLAGMKDDTRFVQTSTPIQPGNSGGPLLDMSGHVVGVIEAQLNAVSMMQLTNSLPQNVNFAIQPSIVTNFLSIKGASPTLVSTSAGTTDLSTSDVADIAQKFTVQVYCQGSPKLATTSAGTPNLLPSAVVDIPKKSAPTTPN